VLGPGPCLPSPVQHYSVLSREEGENKLTGTVAAPAPMADAAAAPIPAAGTVAKPENQPMPVSVTPIQKKKYTKKSFHPVRDDNEPGPSQEQEEEAEPEIILSLSKL